jgi:hypothetical protein
MVVPIVGVGILRPFTRITRLTRVLREIVVKLGLSRVLFGMLVMVRGTWVMVMF